MKKRALISVSDKTDIEKVGARLAALGYEIISTGGTYDVLKKAGLPVIGISDVTGFPECLDGRVKTLHPAVHAGLLAMRSNSTHMEQLEKLNINTIDVVIVNLYPDRYEKGLHCPFLDDLVIEYAFMCRVLVDKIEIMVLLRYKEQIEGLSDVSE